MPPAAARIAERLGRAAPSGSELLDRWVGDGYVRRDAEIVALTPSGSELANKMVRRHQLAERLLTGVIVRECHKAHHEAVRSERVISDHAEFRRVALLRDPSTCPHGSPIPGAARAIGVPAQRRPSGVPGRGPDGAQVPEIEDDSAALGPELSRRLYAVAA